MVSRYFFLCWIFLGFSCFGSESNFSDSDYYPKSQSTYGGIGLIQNPTARFSNDGEFTFGISKEPPYNRLYAKMQFFPWLETVVRYTEGTNLGYFGDSYRISQTWKDKGLDIKIRLFEENTNRPELALGFIDLGGTGSFGSEYLVASKRFGNIDWSIGLGWGRLGGVDHFDNIIGLLDNERKVRGGYGNYGGNINLKRFFSGEHTSVFGGFEYFTPIDNLSFKLEYDTSYYTGIGAPIKIKEVDSDIFELDTRFNIALNYMINITERDKVDLSLGFLHGNTLYANIAVHSNLNFSGKPTITMGAEKLNQPYLEPYSTLNTEWKKYLSDTIMWQMGNAGIVTHRLVFNGNELQAEISQGRFQKTIHAIDLAARFLANNSPNNIETITVINIDQGVETLRASIPRQILVELVANGPLEEEYVEFNNADTVNDNAIIRDNEYLYPHFFMSIQPHLNGTLQHQIQFYFWQLEALIHTEYSIKKGLYLTTDVGIDIVNNFDNYTWHIPDGQLHHVRQNRRLYLTEGESGLRRMSLDYLFDINSNVTAKISAGYLEWMYGGIGGEVLYIPDDKQWALGVDAYWVKQREFDQKFSFQDYQTVTGFISFYYNLPFYDMRFKGSVGKFLGKDTGVNIDISRRFKTGARVGAMASLTNCDASCVGEGSFNKWIYFTLPMDLFSINSTTRGKTGFSWSPLTKDAGTKVESGGLYDLMTNAPDEVDALRRKPWSMKKILSGFGTTSKQKI